MFRALFESMNILQGPTNTVGCINVILLHCNHRHVSAVHVAILRLWEQEYKSFNVSEWIDS